MSTNPLDALLVIALFYAGIVVLVALVAALDALVSRLVPRATAQDRAWRGMDEYDLDASIRLGMPVKREDGP